MMPQTVYDVRRTLTSGKGKIIPIKGEALPSGKWVSVKNHWRCLQVGREVALTPDVALELATELRDRKISNLKKQIARLEALEFLIVDESNA